MALVAPCWVLKKPIQAVIFTMCIAVFFCYLSGTSWASGYNHPTGESIPAADNPHGGYANTTNKCKTCHAVHLAEGNPNQSPGFSLLRANATSDECNYCHAAGGVSQKIIAGESHGIHLTGSRGPEIKCNDCHKVHTTIAGAQFKDNQTLSTTTTCDTCHSPEGAFDGVDDADYGARNNWNWISGESKIYDNSGNLKGGKDKWCAGCHDAGTSEAQSVTAPNIAGDNSSYGYYVSGHKLNCLNCHNSTTDHIDGEYRTYAYSSDNYVAGYRLKYSMNIPLRGPDGTGQSNFELCFRCHSYDNTFDDTAPFNTNFRDDTDVVGHSVNRHASSHLGGGEDARKPNNWDSDWDMSVDSRVTCPACHNVHGSKYPRMIRSGELISTPGTADKVPALDFKWYKSDGTTPTTTFSESYYGDMPPLGGPGAGSIADSKVCNGCHAGGGSIKYYRTPTSGLVGCGTCHAFDQGASGERRTITGGSGDFAKNSHHVEGSVTDGDCLVCHDMTYHLDGDSGTIPDPQVYLNNPDAGASIVYDGAPESVENFCLNCHDSNGANGNTTPLSDGKTVPNVKGVTGSLWQDSAHNQRGYSENANNPITCMGDGSTTGCHGNAHGSDNEKLLSSGSGVAINTFCYRCHTQGKVMNDAISNNRPGGYTSADDIQEAFSKSAKHDLGSSFTVGSDSFAVQCTSCHNPHVITGKYWDAESGQSPITRPNFSDPTNNPRAMGTILWGNESGEKMDDYAALGSGTGGFYYKMAQGYSLGDTGLPFDTAAKYQPPKAGSGYEFEFGGDVLPNYNTFCLDCHQHNMGGNTQGAVNWGGDAHGLTSGNMPGFITDSGTPGFWGTSGNPDVIFDMNYVTRGRHTGHFMRWPYDSADRAAGINFVLACTDCHEAHGANRGSIIRERFNVNANGDCGTGGNPDPDGENCTDASPWNTFCNVCHYYYGGQHAGMSCGPASCHLTVSPHRIDKGGGGGPTQLMLTSAGYESDFQKPDFTPQIDTIEGHIGSNELTVTFTTGVWANVDLSGNLDAGDFWLFDIGGNNPRTITSVTHISGEASATLTMSAPLASADLSTDTLAMKPASAWNWYEGGYNNFATGIVPAQAVSAGPWPVQMTGPPPVAISLATGIDGYNKLHVEFSESVYANTDKTGALQPQDFTFTDSDNGRTVTGVEHTAGETTAILTLSGPLDDTDDIDVDAVAAAGNSIYDDYGNSMGTDPVTVSAMPAPAITSVEGFEGGSKLKVSFSHWVFGNTGKADALEAGDFILTDTGGDNPRTITNVSHEVGDAIAFITMSAPLISADIDTDTIAAAGGSIFNSADYPCGTTPTTISAQTSPAITGAEGLIGSDKVVITFSEGIFTNTGRSGALQASDLVLTDVDNGRTITGVEHTEGTSSAILTLSSALDSSNDIGIDTLAAVSSNALYNRIDNPVDTSAVTIAGNNCPVDGATFQFGEVIGSPTTSDDTGLLVGTVGNPSFSMLGDDLYRGDATESQMTYVDVDNTNLCLKNTRAMTLETRFFMDDVDLDYVDVNPANGLDDDYDAGGIFSQDGDGRNTTVSRIAERKRTFQVMVHRANFGGDYIESRAGKARIQIKYRVTDKGYCDGTYPGDPTVGDGAWMKQIATDIDQYPIVGNHWYQIKIVFNADKSRLVIDIFADDQGEDGNGLNENWSGFKNITRPDPEDSGGCKWAALPGQEMATEDQYLYIGDNPVHTSPQDDPGDYRNSMLKGKLDWFSWKPIVDYSGVDEPPLGGIASVSPSAQSLYFASTMLSNYTPSRKSLPNYLAAGQPISPYLVNAPLDLNNKDVSKNVILLALAVGLMLGGFILTIKAKGIRV